MKSLIFGIYIVYVNKDGPPQNTKEDHTKKINKDNY